MAITSEVEQATVFVCSENNYLLWVERRHLVRMNSPMNQWLLASLLPNVGMHYFIAVLQVFIEDRNLICTRGEGEFFSACLNLMVCAKPDGPHSRAYSTAGASHVPIAWRTFTTSGSTAVF